MKQFVNPKVSDAKIKGGIFVGPQIRKLMQDDEFVKILTPVEKKAWLAFKDVVDNFLGNSKDPRYEQIVSNINHRTEPVEAYFKRNRVEKMKWPAQSPDLNPIENIWAQISQRLDKIIDQRGKARSANELFDRIVDCSADIPLQNIQKLYQSLPKRWNLVIEKQGGPTKY